MAVDVALWFKLGSTTAAIINRLYNTDTVFEPSSFTKAIAGILHAPTGGQVVANRVRARLEPWLPTHLDESLDGDITAALAAATDTLSATDPLAKLAVNIYARRDDAETAIREAGKKHRAALGNERAMTLYDRIIQDCVTVIAELAPKSKTFAVEAATILLQDVPALQEKLDTLLKTTTANQADNANALTQLSSQVAVLSQALENHQRHRTAPQDPAAIAAAISVPRFQTYLARVGNDRDRALELYEWNLRTSASLYTGLAIVEVALRNAMDPHIARFNECQPEVIASDTSSPSDWLLNPARLLVKLTTPPAQRNAPTTGQPRSDIHLAHERASAALRNPRTTSPGDILVQGRVTGIEDHRAPSHDDVLAHTTFGTWGRLLPTSTSHQSGKGRARLWIGYLSAAFPHLEHSPLQLTLHVNALRYLRNRIAHLEPVLDRHQLRVHLESMQLVLGAIHPSLNQWLPDEEIEARITERPRLDPLHAAE